jgi:NAD(P)H-nitrite reductase large subunit
MKYVIIGNGVSALGAIEGIRQYDAEGDILVISDEELTTYGRPLISYVLGGKAQQKNLELRPESYYEQMRVDLKLGTKVECIDLKTKEVVTVLGERIGYDKVLVATGGSPIRPDLPGLDGPGVHTFTTWAHAEELEDQIAAKHKKIAVIGAGLIALKAAEGLNQRDVDVTCIVRSRVLRAYFDAKASSMVTEHLKSKGIQFREGESPVEILRDGDGKVIGVRTDQGLVECQAVVLAAGVAPNKYMAECAGLNVAYGIAVNEFMQTSDPDVYAAGDVAEARDLLTGESRVIPIWPNAYNQGINAGINMAGAEKAYPGSLSMNATAFAGLPTISVGVVDPADDDDTFESFAEADAGAEVYRKLVFRGDRLMGVILIGDVDMAGLYTSFIRFDLPLSDDAKEQLAKGKPSPLFWPEDFFETSMRPGAI